MTASDARPAAPPRCPHVVYRDVLGGELAGRLLDYAVDRRDEFRAGKAWNRATSTGEVDLSRRDCQVLGDLGPFAEPVVERFSDVTRAALDELRIDEPAVAPAELEISSYGDGGHIHSHIDTREDAARVRVLSCVYYFGTTPRRFEGGELRLYGFPSRSGGELDAVVDVPPENDTLVAFPSWMRHEVLPVRLAGDDWRDRRFAVNCWVHRAVGAANGP